MVTDASELGRYQNGWSTDIVTFYEHRYSGDKFFATSTAKELPEFNFIDQLEADTNSAWYEMGLYDKYGHDYFGRTYHQVPDQWGNSEFTGMGAMIERENEAIYTERH